MYIYVEKRPWGRFEKFHENEKSTVKLIYVNPHSRLSLQYHLNRREFWKIIKGSADVEIEDKKQTLQQGDNIEIPLGAKHRIKGLTEGCVILEISYGEFDENDIIRIEDDYRRK
ncbi:MAG: phosphomannose isomerase type II C-terminal cupin domain [Candidatus Nitrosocosmicus sp.]